jgi:hypothetical protein
MKVFIGNYPDGPGEQEIKVEIDKWDTWSMDHTLAHIIHPMLIQLRNTNHGSPYIEDEDVPDELKSTSAASKENEWDIDENHHKRWTWVLDEMIWAFGTMVKDNDIENYYTPYRDDEVVEPMIFDAENEDGTIEPREFMSAEQVRRVGRLDEEKMKAFNGRRKNAFILFGKYYQSLWD